MITTLLLAALVQVPPGDTPQELVHKLLESTSENAAAQLQSKLISNEEAARPAIRSALLQRYQGRALPPDPADLVTKLDGPAILDLQEAGADALDAVENAARTAEGDRKDLLQRVLQAIQKKEKQKADSPRLPPFNPVFRLIPLLASARKSGDELILLQTLLFEPPNPGSTVINALRDYTYSIDSFKALLDAANRRPVTIGRRLWPTLSKAQLSETPDWKALFEKGPPWTRATAAFQLQDPALLETVLNESSSTLRRALVESLADFRMDPRTRIEFATRILTKSADDPSELVRNGVSTPYHQLNLDAPDILLILALNESPSGHPERPIQEAVKSKNAPSEAVMRRLLESGRKDLLLNLSPLLLPGRYPSLVPLVVSAYEKASPSDRHQIALILARFDSEVGIRQIESDLKSTTLWELEAVLEEVMKYRLTRFASQVWALKDDPNGQIAAAARPAAVVLGVVDHPEEALAIFIKDDRARDQVNRLLRDTGGPGDLPLATVLARSSNDSAQMAALALLERLPLTEKNDALAALQESPHEGIRVRVDAILGKIEYPGQLHLTLADLINLDGGKRGKAQVRWLRTDRTGIKFRFVDGAGATKDKVVDVPVTAIRILMGDQTAVAEEIFRNLAPGPVPASLADPTILMRGGPDLLISLLVHRGEKEDVRHLYTKGSGLAEAEPLLRHAKVARAIDAESVDAFLASWLRNPPAGARRDVISRGLSLAASTLPAPALHELLVAMFRDERSDIRQAPVDLVRQQPALAFPAEAVAAFREGKVTDKTHVQVILSAGKSPEGEALLCEWLKDPEPAVRATSAAALARTLKAEAIPLLGSALHDYFRQSRWAALMFLSEGLGERQRTVLQEMLEKAADTEKPFLEVLLYISGVDLYRPRIIALFPEKDLERRVYLAALANRPGSFDETLVEALLRIDKEMRVPGLYLKILVKADTQKSAELAKFILEESTRQNVVDGEFGPALELLVRRLPEPPADLIARYADSTVTALGAVKALTSLGTERALGLLLQVASKSADPKARALVVQTLRSAKRIPALQEEARRLLTGPSSDSTKLASLAYLERDPANLDAVLKFIAEARMLEIVRVAALQTALSIPESDEKVNAAIAAIPDRLQESRTLLAEIMRVFVKGGQVRPLLQGAFQQYRLLFWVWAHDRVAAAEFVGKLSPEYYSQVRDLVEAAAARPLPSYAEALEWSKAPGPNPTPDALAAELKLGGVDDLRKALKDERAYVRVNATWILQQRQGRPAISRGPWVTAGTAYGAGSLTWVFPEPSPEEMELLEKK